eukprot:TRINITY_DN3458_c0_g1_i1.p1 TRINITY_DN3458_c0_g1~~TRINITY_DN3458_c0_g1_i1.p1  ORF type:complete len:561 (-),score=154.58 TRINITY_DN3458_c0_g1_i1:1528-3210(-)
MSDKERTSSYSDVNHFLSSIMTDSEPSRASRSSTPSREGGWTTGDDEQHGDSGDDERLCSLHIGNLHRDLTDSELRHQFQQFGPIDSARIIRKPGAPSNFGFVDFRHASSAREALQALDGTRLMGLVLRISPSYQSGAVQAAPAPSYASDKAAHDRPPGPRPSAATRSVFIPFVPLHVSEHDLRSKFGSFGTIDEVILRNGRNNQSYAFVNFRTIGSATSAKQALDGSTMHGSKISCRFNKGAGPSRHIWIGNVRPELTESDLHTLFGQYGRIESIVIKRSTRCAFVDFVSVDDALEAFRQLQGCVYRDVPLILDLSMLESEPATWRGTSSSSHGGSYLQRPSASSSSDFYPPAHGGDYGGGQRRDQQQQQQAAGEQLGPPVPSSTLHIRYPANFSFTDEELLHEFRDLRVVSVKTFARSYAKPYAFVNFMNEADASYAWKAVAGKLFGGLPGVTINYGRVRCSLLPLLFVLGFVVLWTAAAAGLLLLLFCGLLLAFKCFAHCVRVSVEPLFVRRVRLSCCVLEPCALTCRRSARRAARRRVLRRHRRQQRCTRPGAVRL